MNTITIYINNIVDGDGGVTQYGDASEIINFVRDFRGKLPYNNQASSLLALSLVNTGTTRGALYTIIKAANGGRTQDYLSCYVFIPSEIEITGSEVAELLHKAENIISNDDRNDKAINDIISKPYATKDALPQFASSRRDVTYAVRYYGKGTDYSLQDIVESPYQSYYANFGYVLLSNKDEGTQYPFALKDLTNERIISFVEIKPVNETRGFIPYIDNKEFNQPVSFQEGTKHTLSWKRKGYEDISFSITAKRDLIVPVPRDSDLIKQIPKSSFKLANKKTNEVIASYNCRVDLSERTLPDKYIYIKELNFPNAMIYFSADGYKSRKLSLRDALSDPVIYLEECRFVYNIELSINSVSYTGQKVANHELDWHDLLLPDGFRPTNKHLAYGEDQINRAKWTYNQPKKYNQACDYAFETGNNGRTGYGVNRNKVIEVVLVLALIIVAFIGGHLIKGDPFSNDDQETSTSYSTDTLSANGDQSRLIQYLDSSETWSKDTLESNGLKGLFDDMVNYRFSSIQDDIAVMANPSIKMKKLLDAAKEASDNGVVPPEAPFNYNKEKNTIEIDKYIKRVKKIIKEQSSFVDNYLDSNEFGDEDNSNSPRSSTQKNKEHEAQSSGSSSVKKTSNRSDNGIRTTRADNGSINSAGR